MESVIAYLRSVTYLPPELEARLRKLLRCTEVRRRKYYLEAGQICRHIYFLEKGLVRIFRWHKGKEVTTWLLKEGDVFTVPQSFFGREESMESIVAVEKCVAWGISYEELFETCKLYPEFLWHFVSIMTKYYLFHLKFNDKFATPTNEEKYANLIETSPELLARVPAKYLYSYLDMGKSSFERARDAYVEKKRRK